MVRMRVRKEELSQLLSSLGGEWTVSSTPFGCPQGYSKVYLRRKRVAKAWESLKVRLHMSGCLPNNEAEEMKKQIREQLKKI